MRIPNLIEDPLERRLVAARFAQRMGGEASYFVGILGYAAYTLHADAALIAVIMFCLNAAQMVGSAVGGTVIDRIGPRRMLLASQVSLLVVLVGVQFVGTNVPAFIIAVTLFGVLIAQTNTAFASFAPFVVRGREGLKRVNSSIEAAAYAAAIFGPMIGALIVARAPTLRVFLFNALATLTSMVIMSRMVERHRPGTGEEPKHPLTEARDGIKIIFSMQSLRFYLLAGILIWFSFGAYDALESLYYKDVVGVGVQWMGWVNSVIGVGLIIGVLALSKIPGRYVTAKFLTFALFVVGAGSVVYVATADIRFVLLGGFILGVGFGVAEPLMRTLVQADSPLAYVGRISGSMQLMRIGASLLPLAVAPWLSKQFGVQGVLVGASVLTVALALSLLPKSAFIDRMAAPLRHIDHVDPFADGEDASVHDRTLYPTGDADLLSEEE